MRIRDGQVGFSAEHKVTTTSSQQVAARAWIGSPGAPAPSFPAPPLKEMPAWRAQLQSGAAQLPGREKERADDDALLAACADDHLRNLFLLNAALTGDLEGARRTARSLRDMRAAYDRCGASAPSDANPSGSAPSPTSVASASPAPEGWGATFDSVTTTTKTESVHFAANLQVRTAGGDVLAASVSLDMQHSESSRVEIHVRQGDARRVDPLVLNLDGSTASFSGEQSFDLDSDGRAESLPMLDRGHAYLAWDRNGNGKIDDGGELFGPGSGDGFSELAALDVDGNGWIDESDPAFSQLRLWSPQDKGAPRALSAEKIGALYAGSCATSLPTGDSRAAVSATGVFLRDDGRGGTMQDVDFLLPNPAG